jgi:hypothetical protein
MVNGAANATIFPAGMFKSSQFVKFSADLLRRPALLGQCKIPCNIRPRVNQLRLEIRDRSAHLLINLAADTRDAKEDTVAEQAEGDIDVADAAEDAVATDGVEGLARIPKDE